MLKNTKGLSMARKNVQSKLARNRETVTFIKRSKTGGKETRYTNKISASSARLITMYILLLNFAIFMQHLRHRWRVAGFKPAVRFSSDCRKKIKLLFFWSTNSVIRIISFHSWILPLKSATSSTNSRISKTLRTLQEIILDNLVYHTWAFQFSPNEVFSSARKFPLLRHVISVVSNRTSEHKNIFAC